MAFKTALFVSLLVASVSIPLADAQLPIQLLPNLLSLIRVQGRVFCTVNGNVGVGGTATATPAFPNATVQLRCGAGNTTVASVATNAVGSFSILLDPLHFVLTQVVSSCQVVVTTPLANCNVTLSPTGVLTSTLQSVGNLVSGLNVFNVIPNAFSVVSL